MKPKVTGDDSRPTMLVLGLPTWIHLSGRDTGGAFTWVEHRCPPGSGVPLHYHETDHEMFYVLSGTVEFQADGATHEVGPGGTVYLPPRSRHAFRAIGSEEARLMILVIPAGFEEMLLKLSQLPSPQQDKVAEICAAHKIHFV